MSSLAEWVKTDDFAGKLAARLMAIGKTVEVRDVTYAIRAKMRSEGELSVSVRFLYRDASGKAALLEANNILVGLKDHADSVLGVVVRAVNRVCDDRDARVTATSAAVEAVGTAAKTAGASAASAASAMDALAKAARGRDRGPVRDGDDRRVERPPEHDDHHAGEGSAVNPTFSRNIAIRGDSPGGAFVTGVQERLCLAGFDPDLEALAVVLSVVRESPEVHGPWVVRQEWSGSRADGPPWSIAFEHRLELPQDDDANMRVRRKWLAYRVPRLLWPDLEAAAVGGLMARFHPELQPGVVVPDDGGWALSLGI